SIGERDAKINVGSPGFCSRSDGSFRPLDDAELLVHQEEITPLHTSGGVISLLNEFCDVLFANSGASVALDAYAVNTWHLNCGSFGDAVPSSLNHDIPPIIRDYELLLVQRDIGTVQEGPGCLSKNRD